MTGGRRLRELVRDGLLLLTTSSVELDAGPHRVPSLTELSLNELGLDDSVLGARPGEAWLIRPDGYVSAVLTDLSPRSLRAAIRRTLSAREPARRNLRSSR